jgi:DNA-binding LacI/PurR family transcriptional regulator
MATIDDVARRAGVSASTVSYVLSGKRTISAETRRRVLRSIDELDYRPNASARALASRRVNALALVAPLRADNNVPVVMQFVAAVATAARERDHDVLLVTGEEGDEGVRRVHSASLVDAVLLMDVEDGDARLPMLRTLGLPSVLIGHPEEPEGLSCVDLDHRQAAAVALDHLAALGHRTVGMLGSPPAVYARRSTYAMRFAEGFESAARRRALDAHWCAVDQSFDATSEAIEHIMKALPDLTALVVHNEAILGTVLAVLERLSCKVPEEMSIVALCPTDLAVNQRVGLTSIDVAAQQIGTAAVEMVLRELAGPASAETRLIAPALTVRASTATPKLRSADDHAAVVPALDTRTQS